MIELALLAVAALLGGVIHRHLRHHPDYDLEKVLERSFNALHFPLRDGGQLPGKEVTVLQRPRPYQLSAVQYEAAPDGFWYCAGPDGHFWLAIAQHERQWFLWRVDWVVRPLTAERLRSALQDDPAALLRAFGDVQVDRLYA